MRSLLFVTLLLGAAMGSIYDYTDQSSWSGVCTTGTKQSPVDVITTDVADTIENSVSVLNLPANASSVTLTNQDNSNTIKFEVSTEVTFTGVPGLDSDMEATSAQVHIHWGVNASGSEHLIDGVQHALEMHLVNSYDGGSKYTVFARFFTEGSENAALKKMIAAQEASGDDRNLSEFDLKALYPDTIECVYTYEGSLTTPGCNEIVHWVVVPDLLEVSSAQLATLRTLALGDGSDPAKTFNWRDEQELNGREFTKYISGGVRVVVYPALMALAIALAHLF